MKKVNLEVIKPWITQTVTDLLNFEDDVLIDYVFTLLEVCMCDYHLCVVKSG